MTIDSLKFDFDEFVLAAARKHLTRDSTRANSDAAPLARLLHVVGHELGLSHLVPMRAFIRGTRRRKRNTGAARGKRPDASLRRIATAISVFYLMYTGKAPPRGHATRSSYFRFGMEILRALGFGEHPRVLREAAEGRGRRWQYSSVAPPAKPV